MSEFYVDSKYNWVDSLSAPVVVMLKLWRSGHIIRLTLITCSTSNTHCQQVHKPKIPIKRFLAY